MFRRGPRGAKGTKFVLGADAQPFNRAQVGAVPFPDEFCQAFADLLRDHHLRCETSRAVARRKPRSESCEAEARANQFLKEAMKLAEE